LITDNDYTIDCVTGNFTVTLPSATGIQGRIYIVINSGPGLIILTSSANQTIGNSANSGAKQSIAAGNKITVQSTGAAWRIL
jgi:hypothetical protein